jgi:tetratricopeptide (TPR) repeat protein
MGTNRADQSITTLKELLVLDDDPKNQNIVLGKITLARIYFARRDLAQTKQYLDEVLKDNPKNIDATYLQGMVHLYRGEALPAISAFRMVVNERPQFLQGYADLASAHLLNKEVNIAFDTIQNALKTKPDSRELIRALGRLYASQKDLPHAQAQFRKLLNANPDDLEIRADMGDLFLASGDFGQAAREFEEIKRRVPKSPLGYTKLSACYKAQRQWDKAMAELEPVLQNNPYLWTAPNDLAFLLADHGKGGKDLERALVLAKKAQSLNPDNPILFDTMGWIHYRRGEMKEAVEWITRAQARLPKNPEINYHLGMALHGAGDSAKAREYLQTALASKAGFDGRETAEKALNGLK